MTSSYYRGAQGVILGAPPSPGRHPPSLTCPLGPVYDVTNRETFDSLPSWFSELDTFTSSKDVVRIIVGNKVDKDYSRVVSTDEGQALAEERGAMFFETSAKTMRGVEDVFDTAVEKVRHSICLPSVARADGGGNRSSIPRHYTPARRRGAKLCPGASAV